jgi:hypothetical protein
MAATKFVEHKRTTQDKQQLIAKLTKDFTGYTIAEAQAWLESSMETVRIPVQERLRVSPQLLRTMDFERYVLREIGYDGPLLEGVNAQEPGWSFDPYTQSEIHGDFDPGVAQRYVRDIQKSIAGEKAKGSRTVGLIFGICNGKIRMRRPGGQLFDRQRT